MVSFANLRAITLLFREFEGRLEVVHKKPQRSVKTGQFGGGLQTFKPPVTNRPPDNGTIFLFHPSLIILTIGPAPRDWGRDRRPVINVSWEDAKAYIAWLNGNFGLNGQLDAYRLPSEAEWEYACRAGTTTPFSFGAAISTAQANYNGNLTYGSGQKGEYRQKTTPVGSFPANSFGLRDMHGNVWEWCEDVWNDNFNGAPNNGSAWLTGDSSRRVLRGGSWKNIPQNLRSAHRVSYYPTFPNYIWGFRLARTISSLDG
jgi:formylglycine-generating enzyme required for sulfatase activity